MQSKGLKCAVLGAAAVASVLLTGAAQAALQDRDLNGDTIVDAFYDTDLKITWLRDANVNGPMTWTAGLAWVAGYSFGGYADWRMPIADHCFGYSCSADEMGHLWYSELANPAGGPMTNTGNFQNLQLIGGGGYWSGRDRIGGTPTLFLMSYGYQMPANGLEDIPYSVMAVRDGDVAAVPEAGTYALMLAGLGVLGAVARRLKQG